MIREISNTELVLPRPSRAGSGTIGRIVTFILFLAVLCFALPRQIAAQNSSTSEITGTVTDPTGAVVPSAAVEVLNEATRVSVNVKTSDAGDYTAPFLKPGKYQVTVTHPGFETFTLSHIDLPLGQTVRADAKLTLGKTSEQVSVSSAAVQLETESSQVDMNFPLSEVENLPIENRAPLSLDQLAPGVSTAQAALHGSFYGDEQQTAERMNVQGSRAFEQNATLNGGSIVLPTSNNFVTQMPALAAIQEFSMAENNFSAEWGIGAWVLNVVTKSGTNQFHGNGFEYLENTAMNATPGFTPAGTPKARSVFNQFGGTIGGPVVRNKLFFFFSLEDTTNPSTPNSLVTVPTADMIAGNFTQFLSNPADPTCSKDGDTGCIIDPTTGKQFDYNGVPNTINPSRIDTVAATISKYWPAPNTGAAGATSNNYFRLEPVDPKIPIWDYKADWVINPKHQLTVSGHNHRQIIDYYGKIPGPACYGGETCGPQGQYDDNYQIAERWIINPTMVNAFNVGIIREHYWNTSPTYGKDYPAKLGFNTNIPPYAFPSINVSGGGAAASMGGGTENSAVQNSFIYGDILTWVRGKHSLSMGGDFSRFQINSPLIYGAATFTFNGQYTGNGFADFLLGDVQNYDYSSNLYETGYRRPSGSVFVQDDWKITHSLTANLGLRWEYEGSWYEAHGFNANFSPTAPNPAYGTPGYIGTADGAIVFANGDKWPVQNPHPALFGPHLGFAQSLGSETVLRGGFGLYFQRTDFGDQGTVGAPGFAANEDLTSNASATPPVFQSGFSTSNEVLATIGSQYDYTNPAYTPAAPNLNPAVDNGGGPWWLPYKARQMYSTQYHLSVQRQLSATTTLQAGYVGATGRHLLTIIQSNQVPLSELGTPTDETNPQLLRPWPQFQGILTWDTTTSSRYNAFEAALQRKFSKGFSLLANYTYSSSVDQSSMDLSTWTGGTDTQNQSVLPMTPSDFDEPNRAVVGYVWELPIGKGRALLNQGGAVDAILGGWSTSAHAVINSGYRATIYSSNTNGSCTPGVCVGSGSLEGGVFANKVGNQSNPHTIAEWFNPANYANPPAYTYGNSGRDSMTTPAFWDADANLQKHFNITEYVKFLFRADAYNVFNHKSLDGSSLGTNLCCSNFGTISASTEARILEVGSEISF